MNNALKWATPYLNFLDKLREMRVSISSHTVMSRRAHDEIHRQAGNVRFQFKSGTLAWVKPSELLGVRIARAWDRALGAEVCYQL